MSQHIATRIRHSPEKLNWKKGNRMNSTGIYWIPVEISVKLLRSAGDEFWKRLLYLASKIYELGELPTKFKENFFVIIPKTRWAAKWGPILEVES